MLSQTLFSVSPNRYKKKLLKQHKFVLVVSMVHVWAPQSNVVNTLSIDRVWNSQKALLEEMDYMSSKSNLADFHCETIK